jgi:hypothetical protein
MISQQSKLTQIALEKSGLDLKNLSRESLTWLENRMKMFSLVNRIHSGIVKESPIRAVSTFKLGGLYHFAYDARTKDVLPYWDRFPLCIPLKRYGDGFLGLNLHYLSPRMRAAFLDKLLPLAIMNSDNDVVRLRVTYDILTSTTRYKEFEPCVKRYLTSNIKSKILEVHPNEWEVSLFLPTERFVGATKKQVYQESEQQIKKV